jgi:hypothetical protein
MSDHETKMALRAKRYGLGPDASRAEVNASIRARNALIRAGVDPGEFRSTTSRFSARSSTTYRGFPREKVAWAVGVPVTASDAQMAAACDAAQRAADAERSVLAGTSGSQPARRQFATPAGAAEFMGPDTDAIADAAGGLGTGLLSPAQRQRLVDRGMLPVECAQSGVAGIPVAADGDAANVGGVLERKVSGFPFVGDDGVEYARRDDAA